MTNNADWLAGLKVGDPVVVKHCFGNDTLTTIAKLMKSRILTHESDVRYRRKNGEMVGAPWGLSESRIEKPTPAQARKAKR